MHRHLQLGLMLLSQLQSMASHIRFQIHPDIVIPFYMLIILLTIEQALQDILCLLPRSLIRSIILIFTDMPVHFAAEIWRMILMFILFKQQFMD